MAELSRIFSHLFWLGTHGHDVGAMTPLFYMLREREEIMKPLRTHAGGRLMPNYLRIAGLIQDLAKAFTDRLRKFTEHFDQRVDEYEALLTLNPIYVIEPKALACFRWRMRLHSVQAADDPSSGLAWDVRKREPYCGMNNTASTCRRNGMRRYSRYLVRVAEMRESNKILKQTLDLLPEGPIRAERPGVIFPPQEEIYTRMEALIHHFMLVVRA